MKRPVYFPFTYIPRWVAESLVIYFKHFSIYQPSAMKIPAEMQPWVDADVMEVRVPVRTADEAFGKVVKDFRSFASLHDDPRSLKTAAQLGQDCGIPYFNESAASQIVADVKKDSQAPFSETKFDLLFCARVFLDFAQQFDRQSDDLNQGLGINKRRSQTLIEKLIGEKNTELPTTPLTAEIKGDDVGEYMTRNRLQAWIRLFLEDSIDSGFFVTSSQSVFDHLIENLTGVSKIFQSGGLPVKAAVNDAAHTWRDPLLRQLKQLIETRWPATETDVAEVPPLEFGHVKVTLQLYVVPDHSPADVFVRVLEGQQVDSTSPRQPTALKNTLIGLVTQQIINP